MSKLQEISNQIYERTNKIQEMNPVELPTDQAKTGFSILTILTIVSIVIQLVKLYRSCKQSPPNILQSLSNPNFITRALMKRTIRLTLKSKGLSTNYQYNILQAIIDTSAKLTPEDIVQLDLEVAENS